MLAFGALIDQSLAPLAPELTARLRHSLLAIPGRVSVRAEGEVALAHLADERALPFDTDIPLQDGDLLVAGTLRIDAREQLRAALSGDLAVSPSEVSDARLVALAYRRWGERFAEHLIGDYAIVVWDRAQRRVVCAVDPHGNRQLYWARMQSVVAFGSSVDTVRVLPGLSAALHDASMVSLLRDGWIEDAERTVFRDISRVPAAHTLVLGEDAPPRLRRHWEFPVPAAIRYRYDDEYVAHFKDVLYATLRDRLRGESATVLLSGGMDSPMLAASARRAAPQVALRALTMTHPTVMPSDDDTLSVAVARKLGIDQQILDLDRHVPLRYIDTPALLLSQPFDESDLDSWRDVAHTAAEMAPVALYGEDGDMLLHAPTLLGQLRTQPFAEVMGSWASYWHRTGRRPWAGLEWRRRLALLRDGGEPNRTPWLRAAALRDVAVPRRLRPSHPLRPQTVDALSSPQWDALYATLAPAASLAPVLFTLPLVDPRLLAFVFAIPPVPWCQSKQLFRAAMRDELPPAVLARPKTPYEGYIEASVGQWRTRGGAESPLSDRLASWVELDLVREIYRSGTPYLVLEAWRVLQMDRWLHREEARRA
jgi:asparagine synthase (glutamine-hydrolysing)